MDLVFLSRLQFALTLMFHYLFPPLTIGMGVVLVYLEARHYFTGDKLYLQATRFWANIFGLNFAIGVASGIVMEFQFGTNWAAYSRFVGDVFGSALAAEGIFAFFLESGFLAIVLFGWDRVSKGFHLFSTCMVSLGAIFSSVWIVVANSWQQTPAGHHIVTMMKDGAPWVVHGEAMRRAEILDFWQMLFNPSSVIRLTHVLVGCFIMGSLFILSISAWYLLQRRHLEFAKHSFRGALLFLTIFSFAALFTGHTQARVTYRHQPAKLAAAEGHFETGRGNLVIFGIPDPANRTVHFPIEIPGGLSFLLFNNFSTPVAGLDKFRAEDLPPVMVPFVSWRLMIGLGMFFIALSVVASIYLWKGSLFEKRWLLWIFVFAVIGGVFANQAGWIMAEVGRQPWTVYPPTAWNGDALVTAADGLVQYDESQGLRTAASVSKLLSREQVLTSILGFSLLYSLLFVLWVFILNQKIQHGPEAGGETEGTIRN